MNSRLFDYLESDKCYICGNSATCKFKTNDGRSFDICSSKSCKTEISYILQEVRK